MITQRPISLKIDECTLESLDQECFISAEKRNRVINRSIDFYLDYIDTRRRIKLVKGDYHRLKMIEEFNNKYF